MNEVLAQAGIGFISLMGYTIITGGLGTLMTLDDKNATGAISWIIGGFLYAATVMMMWQK